MCTVSTDTSHFPCADRIAPSTSKIRIWTRNCAEELDCQLFWARNLAGGLAWSADFPASFIEAESWTVL